MSYFSDGLVPFGNTVGAEIETSHTTRDGIPARVHDSQCIFEHLLQQGWRIAAKKGPIISCVDDAMGNRIMYELGSQNIEVATAPTTPERLLEQCKIPLTELYRAAVQAHVMPRFQPILETDENTLLITDDRDAVWVTLDGMDALKLLSTIASVQFTIEVPQENAIQCLNTPGEAPATFLEDYPHDCIGGQ